MNPKRFPARGFTLIELLVTLLLISLTLTLVSPNLFNTLAGVEQKTTLQQLYTDLAELRLRAFLLEQPLRLELTDNQLTAYAPENDNPMLQQRYPGLEFETQTVLISLTGSPRPTTITLEQQGKWVDMELKPWP